MNCKFCRNYFPTWGLIFAIVDKYLRAFDKNSIINVVAPFNALIQLFNAAKDS